MSWDAKVYGAVVFGWAPVYSGGFAFLGVVTAEHKSRASAWLLWTHLLLLPFPTMI